MNHKTTFFAVLIATLLVSSVLFTSAFATGPPNKPGNLRILGQPTETSITLIWDKNVTNGNSNVLGFKIYRAPATGFANGQPTFGAFSLQLSNFTNISGNTVTYRNSTLGAGQFFKFSIIAINGTGSSLNSTTMVGTKFLSGTTDFSSGTQNFQDGQTFGTGIVFAPGQVFTGTQTFGNNTNFAAGTIFATGQQFTGVQDFADSSLKFGFGTNFGSSAQTFGTGVNFTGAQIFPPNVVNTFGSNAVFGAAQTFGTAGQQFGSGTTFGPRTVFSGVQDFADPSLKFGNGTVFGAPQTFGTGTNFTGAQTFTGYNIFGSGVKFGAGQTFNTKQNFGPLANFTSKITFPTGQFFGAGTVFPKCIPGVPGSCQVFDAGSTFSFTNSSMSFGNGTVFGAPRTFGAGANFTGAQTFTGANSFGTAVEFGAGQTFPNTAQSFGTNAQFGKNTNFGTAEQIFLAGSKFDSGTTFKSGQPMPANTVLATGLLLTASKCDTSCGNMTASSVLTPGEKLLPGTDPTAIGAYISTTDKSIKIPGLGFEMTFSSVTTAGTVAADLMNPSSVSAATATSDGSLTMTANNGNVLHSLTSIMDISVNATSGAAATGSMIITLPYDETALGGASESNLKMIHYTGGAWVTENSCTTDTTNNKITCTVTSLSPFGIGTSTSTSTGGGRGTSGSPSFDSSSFILKKDGAKISSNSLSSTLTVGKKSDISMGFEMPSGLGELNHIGLYANIDKDQVKYDSDTYIYFDKYNTPQITIHDPHGFFKSVNVDVTEPSSNNLDVHFTLDFVKSLDKSSVIFEAWNNDRQSAMTEIPDLLKVNDPTKPETPPETETIQPTTQERPPVPDWLKSNAAWWGKGAIDDKEFANGIGYLIQKQIINVPELLQKNTSPEKTNPDTDLIEPQEEFTPIVPAWVKNNASWWSEGKLTDDDFLIGIKYLLEKDIIRVMI